MPGVYVKLYYQVLRTLNIQFPLAMFFFGYYTPGKWG